MPIRCTEFLEEFSDYLDGLQPPDRAADMDDHLRECASCARYEKVVTNGLRHVRDLPEAEPSSDFLPRLQHRIYHLEDELALRRGGGRSTSFTLGLVAALALAAWVPLASTRPARVELEPVVAIREQVERPVPLLFQAGPLFPESALASRQWATPVLFESLSPPSRPVTLRISMPVRR